MDRTCAPEGPPAVHAEDSGPEGSVGLGEAPEGFRTLASPVILREVQVTEQGAEWELSLNEEQLQSFEKGDVISSPVFAFGGGTARFMLYPHGDVTCEKEHTCSLWLWASAGLKPRLQETPSQQYRLALGEVEKEAGASEFANLREELTKGGGSISLRLLGASEAPPSDAADALASSSPLQHAMQLQDLGAVEWTLRFKDKEELFSGSSAAQGQPIESQAFRFYHVLLGDFYLELLPNKPHPKYCALLLRFNLPDLVVKARLASGEENQFSKSCVFRGGDASETAMKEGAFLAVNLEAPGVLESQVGEGKPKGWSIRVRCELEEVLQLPRYLQGEL